jgi:hypothetical protein
MLFFASGRLPELTLGLSKPQHAFSAQDFMGYFMDFPKTGN